MKLDPARLARAQRMRSEGFTYKEIGDAMNVSASCVGLWLNPEMAERNRVRQRLDTIRRNDRIPKDKRRRQCYSIAAARAGLGG